MSTLARAALLGVATGGRSSIGLGSLAASADRGSGSPLTSRWVAGLAAAGVATELVIDKLPATPSRLLPRNLAARLAFGTVAAAILSHREGDSRSRTLLAGSVGLAAAAAGSRLGAGWRASASQRFGKDLPGALIEDLLCCAAVGVATRR